MGGTGLIEGGTFLAILGGQLLAGVIPPGKRASRRWRLPGWVSRPAWPCPRPADPRSPPCRLERVARHREILRTARHGRGVWLSILGISWFFAAGAVLVSEFAPLVSGTLSARQEVVTLFLSFSRSRSRSDRWR
jgi:acyl-[acyl-carrier-protein]-phospholipid O-acyltransferase/long-chain-fatty-acid--[acyl-carrier-protein] ligase